MARKNGAIAIQPCPAPAEVRTVCVKSPEPKRWNQRPVCAMSPRLAAVYMLFRSKGSVAVAATMKTTEPSASAAVVNGARRHTRASGTARNGIIGMR